MKSPDQTLSFWKMNTNKDSIKATVYGLCNASLLFGLILSYYSIAVHRLLMSKAVTELFSFRLNVLPKELAPLRTFERHYGYNARGGHSHSKAGSYNGLFGNMHDGYMSQTASMIPKTSGTFRQDGQSGPSIDDLIDYEDIEDV